MRVFYAITFDKKTKEKLAQYKDIVKTGSVKGRFTDTNNIHLTLEFIGEVNEEKLNVLKNVLYKLKYRVDNIKASYIGSFKRKNKEIVWVGIEENKNLEMLNKELKNLLMEKGFNVDTRKYKPHITLGRQVVTNLSLDNIIRNPFELKLKSIALMESIRIDGKLTYREIEEVNLY